MNDIDQELYIVEAFHPAVQRKDIAAPATTIILARDEGSSGRPLIGYVQLVSHKDHVELKRFYVALSQKGGGLAAALMDEVRNECRRLHAERLRLTVWTLNPRAVTFYGKMGFDIIGSETFMVGEDAQVDHVMEATVPFVS